MNISHQVKEIIKQEVIKTRAFYQDNIQEMIEDHWDSELDQYTRSKANEFTEKSASKGTLIKNVVLSLIDLEANEMATHFKNNEGYGDVETN